jgi:hypothetical protein
MSRKVGNRVQVTIMVDTKDHEVVEKIAKDEGRSNADVYRRLIKNQTKESV